MKETKTIVTLTDDSGRTIHPKTLADAVINLESGKSVSREMKDLLRSVAEKGKEVTKKIREYKKAIDTVTESIDTKIQEAKTELEQAVAQVSQSGAASDLELARKIESLETSLSSLSGVSDSISELFSGKISKDAFEPSLNEETGEMSFQLGQGTEKKVTLPKSKRYLSWESEVKIRFGESAETIGGNAGYEWDNEYDFSDHKRYGNGNYIPVPIALATDQVTRKTWGEEIIDYLGGKFIIELEGEYDNPDNPGRGFRRLSSSFRIKTTPYSDKYGSMAGNYGIYHILKVDDLEQGVMAIGEGLYSGKGKQVFENVQVRGNYLCVLIEKNQAELNDKIYNLRIRFEGSGFSEIKDTLSDIYPDGTKVVDIWKEGSKAHTGLTGINFGIPVLNKRLPYINHRVREGHKVNRSIQRPETITIIDNYLNKYGGGNYVDEVNNSISRGERFLFIGAIPRLDQYYYDRDYPLARYKFYLEGAGNFALDLSIDIKTFINPLLNNNYFMKYSLGFSDRYGGVGGRKIQSLVMSQGGRTGDLDWIGTSMGSKENDISLINYLFIELGEQFRFDGNNFVLSVTKEWGQDDLDLFAADYLFEPLKLYNRSQVFTGHITSKYSFEKTYTESPYNSEIGHFREIAST